MIKWLKSYCRVCFKRFDYPVDTESDVGYEPKTCTEPGCAFEYSHNPEKYKSLFDHLDRCRVNSKI